MTKAANTLHISQPVLSKQMTDLEEQLGTKLFIRGNKNIAANISTGAANLLVDIYLGCGESHVMNHIVGIFENIQKDYPDIHFQIYSVNAESVLECLNRGLLDRL